MWLILLNSTSVLIKCILAVHISLETCPLSQATSHTESTVKHARYPGENIKGTTYNNRASLLAFSSDCNM